MQISKVTSIASLAGLLTLGLQAQPASPELQNKALELLRQTLAQDQKQPQPHPARSNPLPVGTVPAAGVTQPAQAQSSPSPAPVMTTPANTDQQQALQLLRQTIDQQRAAAPQAVTPVAKQASSSKLRPSNKSATPSKSTSGQIGTAAAPGQTDVTNVQSAAPEQAAGPKTKQERLMDLLEQYKADKLTPAEYHAQRAKILSEP